MAAAEACSVGSRQILIVPSPRLGFVSGMSRPTAMTPAFWLTMHISLAEDCAEIPETSLATRFLVTMLAAEHRHPRAGQPNWRIVQARESLTRPKESRRLEET